VTVTTDDDADVVILVPILSRAHRVAPLMESVRATCGARVLFLTSPGDSAVHRAIADTGAAQLVVAQQRYGDYARKINAGVRHTTQPLIFTGADDLEFQPGWLAAARTYLVDGIGVVGTNDLGSPRVMAGAHATHFLFTRWYIEEYGTIDEPGKAMHEGYPHEYVDDEVVGTAIRRGMWAFAVDSHVKHLHPDWYAEVPRDAMYAGQGARMRLGRPIYQRRRRLWVS
jgi:hypothetical protein